MLCYLVTPLSIPQFGVNECHDADELFNAALKGGHDSIDIIKVKNRLKFTGLQISTLPT